MKERIRMKERAAAWKNKEPARKEREIVDDFRDYVREYLYYHLEDEDYYTVLRSRCYRRWMRELNGKRVAEAWIEGSYCSRLLEQVFCRNEAFDEYWGTDIWLDAKTENGRWEAYLDCIAPRALRNAKPNPWEEGYDGRFWPWREKLSWFHRKKKDAVVRNVETTGRMQKKLYKITLCDRCNPAWVDLPLLLFTEDMEDFQRRWLPLEKAFWYTRYGIDGFDEDEEDEYVLRLKDRETRLANRRFQSNVKKFYRSKSGRIVCLYHNKPEYNIVQATTSTIYVEKNFVVKDAWFTHTSIYDYWSHFHVDRWAIRFRWISFRGDYFRIASYRAEGACQFDLEPKRLWQVENQSKNAVYEISSPYAPDNGEWEQDDTPMRNSSFQDFAKNTVTTIADTVAKKYETESALLADAESFTITEGIMKDLFWDMAGV